MKKLTQWFGNSFHLERELYMYVFTGDIFNYILHETYSLVVLLLKEEAT
jgi:hypothetical protein